jgi:seryl-tRNA synthetase
MIDLKELRADPERFQIGARNKGIDVDIERLLDLDGKRRALLARQEATRAEQKKLSKAIGPQIGALKKQIKQATEADRPGLENDLRELEQRPLALKAEIQEHDRQIAELEPAWRALWLEVPQPADPDVPVGASPEENVELRRWKPDWFDPQQPFRGNKGFEPRTHMELAADLKLVDFERGVRMAGTRSYVLTGDGMRLHQAVLRLGLDYITTRHGFCPLSVPLLVREECMEGTGFFPTGRDQAYHVEESRRGAGHDLFLVGTGEVSLMALHADEILEADQLPLKYATTSTCFRRRASGARRGRRARTPRACTASTSSTRSSRSSSAGPTRPRAEAGTSRCCRSPRRSCSSSSFRTGSSSAAPATWVPRTRT